MMISLGILAGFMIPGFLAARAIVQGRNIPQSSGLSAALSLPLGFALYSCLIFFSFVTAQSKGAELALCLYLLSTAALAVSIFPCGSAKDVSGETWPSPRQLMIRLVTEARIRFPSSLSKVSWITLLALIFFAFVTWSYLAYFAAQTASNPLGGWDARYFWLLKARFYFRDPAAWQGMFSSLPGEWSHPDYPLMMPGAYAGSWFLVNRESLIGPILVSLGFALSLAGLILWYLWVHTSARVALIAGAFFMSIPMWRFWSTTLYADIPLAFFMTAAGMFTVLGLRKQDSRLLFSAGIFAGLALWTKDEGLLFLIWLCLCVGAASAPFKDPLAVLKNRILPLVLAVIIPLAAVFLIKKFLGTTGGQFLGSGRSLADYGTLLFGNFQKTQLITFVFGLFASNHAQWNGLWFLVLFAALFCGRRGYGSYRWVYLTLAILVWFGYFVILHVTRFDLKFQIETALLRIMSHSMGLAFIFSIESLFFTREKAIKNR